ncbi:hypothetical protein UA08_09173 [Talaromyces atroroseus]|uniref:FAD-binding domain-containing protein n=1 Tax=Talaromyces atroroseus TaxID=1441469 RepID=A0A1Q5Q6W7_TALAT|nr:hypothetical protein UA08_09173 [Talaromyces atroroseus]OKL55586.1 hypothetical protein UA08_09173 [Talaromyces atroroseus]
MTALKILICGAGITGNALAFWLANLGHETTVVERFPNLRASGLQVDLRGPGIQVIRRMGLEELFRERSVPEQGLRLVDDKGRSWGYFPVNKSGRELQSFTTDFEIMRGDLCQLLYDTTKKFDRVRYRFGIYVQQIEQTDRYAEVIFSDGGKERFDLVVGADGQGSRTRSMMLQSDNNDGKLDRSSGYEVPEKSAAEEPFQPLGVIAGYFTVYQEVQEAKDYDASIYLTTQARGIMTRRHDPHKYQTYLFCSANKSARLKAATKGDVDEEKRALTEVFRGIGWQSKEEILTGLAESDDFYCERIGVVVLNYWPSRRIALVGDAAYCPSVMTGMGTSCGVVGAYILAGEIARYCGKDSEGAMHGIVTALDSYEQKLRPLMNHIQKGLTNNPNYMDQLPSSNWAIGLMYVLFRVASLLRLDFLARWVLREDTNGWELPEYPEMTA